MDKKKFNNAIEKSENLANEKTGPYFAPNDEIYANRSIIGTFGDDNIDKIPDKGESEALFKKQNDERIKEKKREMRALEKEKIKRAKLRKREELLSKKQADEKENSNKNFKEEESARKIANKREKRRKNNSNSVTGWIVAVVSLSTICLALTTTLIYNNYSRSQGEIMLANGYARNFYDLVDYVDNIDINLSKLTLSNDNDNKQKILTDIITEANLAENDLASLPIEDSSKYNTMKYLNQVGDFSKYANNKLIDGLSLSEKDYETLNELKKINLNLKNSLHELSDDLGENFDFSTLLLGEANNPVLVAFSELEYHSLEYPKMIYDGPFADEPEQMDRKGDKKAEKCNEISKEEAIKRFEGYFSDYQITDATVNGVAEGKKFKVYNVEAKAFGQDIYAQISMDGKLVECNFYHPSKKQVLTGDECIVVANAFLKKCGYKSIKAVWTTIDNNTAYINFASVNEGGEIIIYADLIKVSVCMESGIVCDVDARLFIENHTRREIPSPALTVEQAEKKLSKEISVESSRLAYIPLPSGSERLAYEFFGRCSEGEFYIYVDAITGHELTIFKVVESSNGRLLL